MNEKNTATQEKGKSEREIKWKIYCLTRVSFLCFVDRSSRYNCVNKNQLDVQFILSPKHVEVDEIYEEYVVQ